MLDFDFYSKQFIAVLLKSQSHAQAKNHFVLNIFYF